jgi:hypothetical protein
MAINEIKNDFRPPENLFDSGDAIQNYIAWRDAEVERHLNDSEGEYWPWRLANYSEAMREFVAENLAIKFAIHNSHHNVIELVQLAVVGYWRVLLIRKYDAKSGVM